MSAALQQLARRVHAASGIVVDTERSTALRGAVERVRAGTPAELLTQLDDTARGRGLLDRLVDEIAVKETFFLRNADELARLDWRSLYADARVRGADRVRVWCTACASGDEAYSLAILALEAFGTTTPPVEILATDVAPSALDRAGRGRYRPRAVQYVPAELRERWFEPPDPDGLVRVRQPVRALVRLARHNLVRDPIPPPGEGAFDVITCRNVLIYFAADEITTTVRGLRSALAPDGQLILGAADRLSASRALGRHDHRLTPSAASRARRAAAAATTAGAVAPPASVAPDPELDADVALLLGRAARARGDHEEAVRWLRRTLYLDPARAVAALELALAHAAVGDAAAQRRALWTALRTAEAPGGDSELVAECRTRLRDLDRARPHPGVTP